jgi:DNA (cytosine-5)-methyltransferase 1
LVLEDFKGYLKSVVNSLLQMKYQIRVQVLSSEKYGDPQKRRRLILLAARSDCKLPEMPAPSHGLGLYPIVTSKDVLWKFEKELPTKSNSCGAVFIGDTVVYNHIIPKYKPPADEYKLVKDEPSRTVLARSRPHVHYNGERFISVREAACLQSFPITYRFYGSLASQLSQVGNAVPVKLSTAIARSVAVVHGCAV